MNKKRLSFLIYCLVTVFIFTATLSVLAGCKRTSKTVPNPKPRDPAELAAEKISEYSHPEALISVHELNKNLNDPNLAVLDTRGRSFQVYAASYPPGHIPVAIPFLHSEYTHPAFHDRLATPALVQKALGDKGINNQKRIVIYGNDGLHGRVYWMLKAYGCDNAIQMLDGGFEKWKESGYPITGQPLITPSQFVFNPAKGDPNIYTTLEEIVDSILNYTPSTIIVDARSGNEYLSGHIPCSVNISFSDVLNEDTTFKPAHELTAMLARKGVTPDKKVLVYSHSGVRSSLIWYVLHELMGYPNVKNYDGGFFEWMERELVIEYGEQKLVVKPAQ